MDNCNDSQIPLLTAIKSFKNLYESIPLQYSCLVRIASSLNKVEDVEQLTLPEKLKEILRSKPISLLIGIQRSDQEDDNSWPATP